MIQFVFFGRLVEEKGIDIIINVIKKFIDNNNKNLNKIQFFICGEGPYKQQILNLIKKTKNLHFFGRCDKSQLIQKIASAHYTLMPSMFLETFGLSALESLSLGVPVIGFAKGGLKNFIPNSLDIAKQKGEDNIEKLYNLINFIIKNNSEIKIQKNTQQSLDIAKHYFPKNWIKNFNNISSSLISRINNKEQKNKKIKKILLISDYKTIYGGIETYLYKTKDILRNNGYECEIWGADFGKGFIGNIIKKISFFGSFFNIISGLKLFFYIKKNKPDLIRRNSCLRMLGRFPLRILRNFEGQQRMMYHDLGYFHPFPSEVEQIEQITTKWSVFSFCKSLFKEKKTSKKDFFIIIKEYLKIPFVIGKFILLNLLKKQLTKNIDIHLIPSSFMKDIIKNLYNIEDKIIKVFPHCLDEFFVGVNSGIKKEINKQNN